MMSLNIETKCSLVRNLATSIGQWCVHSIVQVSTSSVGFACLVVGTFLLALKKEEFLLECS